MRMFRNVVGAVLLGLLGARAFAGAGPMMDDKAPGAGTTSPGKDVPWMLKPVINVLPLRTANNDGTTPGEMTEEQFKVMLNGWNTIAERSHYNVTFVRDPRTNLGKTINDRYLNNDCINNYGSEAKVEKLTDKSLDPEKICSKTPVHEARDAMALQYPDALVIFVRGGNKTAKWDADQKHWYLKAASGGHSSFNRFYVVILKGSHDRSLLAHESGHYFNLDHTFGGHRLTTVAQAQKVADKVVFEENQVKDAASILFDGDGNISKKTPPEVLDTPPDVGPGLWLEYVPSNGGSPINVACDAAYPTMKLPVILKVKTNSPIGTPTVMPLPQILTITPDRGNVMSYFKGCYSFNQHYSPQQVKRMMLTFKEKRAPLLNPKIAKCVIDAGVQNPYPGWTWHKLFERNLGYMQGCLKQAAIDIHIGEDGYVPVDDD